MKGGVKTCIRQNKNYEDLVEQRRRHQGILVVAEPKKKNGTAQGLKGSSYRLREVGRADPWAIFWASYGQNNLFPCVD